MKKYKYFVNFEKEEEWLSEMAQKGWFLVGKTAILGAYEFRQEQLNEIIYRIDYRTFNNSSDFTEYIQLFEDSGWKHICGTRTSGAQYFERMNSDVNDEIFSDNASRAGRYRRFSSIWLSLLFCYSCLLIAFIGTGIISISSVLNPKSLYLTPGLWELKGGAFWRAFLFETPFAFMRGFSWLFVLIAIASFLYYFIKTWREGKKYL